MPYAPATRLNLLNSTITPPLHISLLSPPSSLVPDPFFRDKILSVLPSLSSQYNVSSPRAVTRTPAPITFTVSKPLKSSLRCSSTGPFSGSKETSAPTRPNVRRNAFASSSRKSVRFKDSDDGLESICFFHATGRPSTLLNLDSDTESDTESSDASSVHSLVLANVAEAAAAVSPLLKLTDISPIPSSYTSQHPYIRLESITPLLAGARPPLLCGRVRVRNIAYEKRVAARFTIDDWTTVSEVLARYAGPAGGAHDDDGTWDRFTFSISLEFCAPRPRPPPARTSSSRSHASADSRSHSRAFTLLLAVRFTVPGVGEWWDNNGGHDFRILLAHAHQASSPTTEFPRRPQGFTCFTGAQATMASLFNPCVAPAPAVVTN